MFRALFFDFDGLILDTETPEVQGWSEIFQRHGETFPMDYWADSVGRGADQITETPIQVLERLTGQTFDHVALKAEYDELRLTKIHQNLPLPGVISLLKEAKAADFPCAVVSSSKRRWVEGHLTRLGLTDYFRTTVCADDVPRAKPFPDLYLEALNRFGISANEAIALEDSPNGTRAAVAAKIYVIAIPNEVTATLDISHANLQLPTMEGLTLGILSSVLVD